MRRMIREDDPPRPSARISTLNAQAISTISQQRSTDPQRISATLRGELDGPAAFYLRKIAALDGKKITGTWDGIIELTEK